MTNKNKKGRKRSSLMLRFFFQKLKKGQAAAMAARGTALSDDEDSEVASTVPEVHFTVFAIKGEETQRFILELEYLTNLAFLRLLEQAEEEYGFKQKGVLAVLCCPVELQKILDDKKKVTSGLGNLD